MNTLTLDDIINSVPDLPALPSAVLAVMRETTSASATSSSVANQILTDQGLSARVLRLSNSAYYGLTREVGKVQDAVTILGFRTVRSLVMVAGTYPLLKRRLEGYAMEGEDLWHHSAAVAVAASVLARQTERFNADEAFCHGLLHDIGKVALAETLNGSLPKLMKMVERGSPFDEAERQVLGFDHGEVGAHLATRWNLPKPFVDAARWHHRPDENPTPSLTVDAVHVAGVIAMQLGYGLGADGLGYTLSWSAIHRLGLDADALERVTANVEEAVCAHRTLFDTAASS